MAKKPVTASLPTQCSRRWNCYLDTGGPWSQESRGTWYSIGFEFLPNHWYKKQSLTLHLKDFRFQNPHISWDTLRFFSPKTVYSKNLLYIVVAHTQTTKSRTNCMYMLCNYSYLLKSKFLSANMGVLLIFLPHTIMEYLWPFMTKLFSMNENFCYQFLFPIISNSDAITYCEYSLFLLLLSKRKIDYEN